MNNENINIFKQCYEEYNIYIWIAFISLCAYGNFTALVL